MVFALHADEFSAKENDLIKESARTTITCMTF